jgi:two-component system response regulator RegA
LAVISFRKLLVVDDDELILRSYTRAFSSVVQVFTAPTSAVATFVARTERPDLVVVDLRLRNEWGVDVVKRLREILPASRIVLASAFVSASSAVAAVRAGADDVIAKPVRAGDLERELAAKPSTDPFPSLARIEWDHILRALDACSGNVSRAARLLGVRRTSLQRKLKRGPPGQG